MAAVVPEVVVRATAITIISISTAPWMFVVSRRCSCCCCCRLLAARLRTNQWQQRLFVLLHPYTHLVKPGDQLSEHDMHVCCMHTVSSPSLWLISKTGGSDTPGVFSRYEKLFTCLCAPWHPPRSHAAGQALPGTPAGGLAQVART